MGKQPRVGTSQEALNRLMDQGPGGSERGGGFGSGLKNTLRGIFGGGRERKVQPQPHQPKEPEETAHEMLLRLAAEKNAQDANQPPQRPDWEKLKKLAAHPWSQSPGFDSLPLQDKRELLKEDANLRELLKQIEPGDRMPGDHRSRDKIVGDIDRLTEQLKKLRKYHSDPNDPLYDYYRQQEDALLGVEKESGRTRFDKP